jgi:hypothetical protein
MYLTFTISVTISVKETDTRSPKVPLWRSRGLRTKNMDTIAIMTNGTTTARTYPNEEYARATN